MLRDRDEQKEQEESAGSYLMYLGPSGPGHTWQHLQSEVLSHSVPPSLDKEVWHLVGMLGFVLEQGYT